MTHRILFIGVQGSGKGTQAKPLAQFLGIPYVGTGEILRAKAQEKSGDGLRIKKILDQGQLLSDTEMVKLVTDRLSQKDSQNGFVLDGYPRTLEQLQLFNPQLTKVFYLELSDEEAIKRMQSRGRTDDTPEIVAKRIKIFHQETEPIIDYYRQQGILQIIDGRPAIEVIQKNIRGIFSND